jgi:hypothetical protein
MREFLSMRLANDRMARQAARQSYLLARLWREAANAVKAADARARLRQW